MKIHTYVSMYFLFFFWNFHTQVSITIISKIRFNIAKIDGIGKRNAFPVNMIINTILCYYGKYETIGNDLSLKTKV